MVAGSEGTLRVVRGGGDPLRRGSLPVWGSDDGGEYGLDYDRRRQRDGGARDDRPVWRCLRTWGHGRGRGVGDRDRGVNLGDAVDEVVVLGRVDDDAIFVGQNGVALNADGDVDVTFVPLPAALEVRGGGATITGGGSQGAGARFLGELLLFGGDLGDHG